MPRGTASTSSRLEPVSETHRRLGAVRDAIKTVQPRQVVCRRVVHQAAIFRPHKQALPKVEIGAAAVDESSARLCACSREIPRIEYQAADAGEHKGRPMFLRESQNIIGRDLMRICL